MLYKHTLSYDTTRQAEVAARTLEDSFYLESEITGDGQDEVVLYTDLRFDADEKRNIAKTCRPVSVEFNVITNEL